MVAQERVGAENIVATDEVVTKASNDVAVECEHTQVYREITGRIMGETAVERTNERECVSQMHV